LRKDVESFLCYIVGEPRTRRTFHMEILVTENLRKYYQLGDATVRALDGISLTVEKGEFIAIVGRSGSGGHVKIRLS